MRGGTWDRKHSRKEMMLLIEREDGMIEGSGADKAIDTLCSTRLNG